ncbi:MAG: hypothetical protein ABI358_01060, partial [Ginsengibacter sp.]
TMCNIGLSKATFAEVKPVDPVEIKCIGKNKSNPVFQLKLNNKDAEQYFITIKDEHCKVLFSEKIKGVNLTRKYQLDMDEASSNAQQFGLRIEVTSAKTSKTETYNLRSKPTETENIVAAKL